MELSDSPTTLTELEVTALMATANISPTHFQFRIPKKHDRANQPPKGYISVYKNQIQMGLRFPLHDLLLQILNRIKVSPSQLRPLSHAMVAGFILCAKLYDIPATADCFFGLNNVKWVQADHMCSFVERCRSLKFLLVDNESFWDDGEWMKEFFFLRPVGKFWDCVTKWRKTRCYVPKVDEAFFRELVDKSGLLQSGGFEITELMRKDVLIHGGIEPPGDVSPRFTFRYLIHRAAKNKFELLPEDMPPANATDNAASKRPLSADANIPNPNTSNAPESVFVPEDCSEKLRKEKQLVSSELALMKLIVQGMIQENEQNKAKIMDLELMRSSVEVLKQENELYKAKMVDLELTKSSVEELKQQNELYKAKVVELVVMKSRIQELKQENELYKAKTMDFEVMKSSVQELKQENELYKAKIVDSEHRTIQAKVKVKVLEERLENLKSESDCLRDSIIKHVIEEFKSSDEFANAVKEEATKSYVKGFETCKQRVLDSGKLPSGFNFKFLDAADAEWGSSSGQVDTSAADPDRKHSKRKKTSKLR